MKALFLMVLLSQNGAGDINISFVNTETLAQCQQKQQVIQGIFSSARIPILASRCLESEQRYTPFEHSASSSTPRHFYLVTVGEASIEIEPMPDWLTCNDAQRNANGPDRAYCGSSIQQRLD